MSQKKRDRDELHEIPSGILSPLTIARYRRDLTYRQSREQKYGDRLGDTMLGQSILYVAWGITIILGAILAWRLLSYTIPAAKIGAFAIWGQRVQGTILQKKTDRANLRSPKYVITYGYWVEDTGIISRTNVPEEVFVPLVVDDEVAVIYLPNKPEWSMLRNAMSLRWPVDVLVTGGIFALACVGLGRLRGLASWNAEGPDTAGQETGADNEGQPE